MNTWTNLLFLVVGVAVVGFLLTAFVRGRRLQAREDPGPLDASPPSTRRPSPPRGVHEGEERGREPDVAPGDGHGGRTPPHAMKGYGNFGSRPVDPEPDDREDRPGGR
ncbi:DUF6479 family protein (plasmid) [Streptomyces sp. BI20]|uniref:DUF6479 family protein n=1 Tax=Streptomyces sp. BI20 TaxID=3403460 RepID=UPI003C796B9F